MRLWKELWKSRWLLSSFLVFGVLLVGTGPISGWARYGDGPELLRSVAVLLFWIIGLGVFLVCMKKDMDQGHR